MSTMTLIRHGQASFLEANYDQLSKIGEVQARLLGEYWLQQGYCFDQVYTGPRLRQKRTAELIGEVVSSGKITWPSPIEVPELDEYDLNGLMRHLVPALAASDRQFADLCTIFEKSHELRDRLRSFQGMFEKLLLAWQDNILPTDEIETWAAFKQRVEQAIREIQINAAHGSRVAVASSGGFIGAAVQSVLAAPDRSALELNWRVRNCSITEFVFNRNRVTLDSFNAIPHLTDPVLWTYR